MNDPHRATLEILKALSNEKRLLILEWLLDPVAHFPKQIDGDLIEDGVCLGAIVRKAEANQPTVSGYMQNLMDAGLVSSKRIKNWVFFKPRRDVISAALVDLGKRLSSSSETETSKLPRGSARALSRGSARVRRARGFSGI